MIATFASDGGAAGPRPVAQACFWLMSPQRNAASLSRGCARPAGGRGMRATPGSSGRHGPTTSPGARPGPQTQRRALATGRLTAASGWLNPPRSAADRPATATRVGRALSLNVCPYWAPPSPRSRAGGPDCPSPLIERIPAGDGWTISRGHSGRERSLRGSRQPVIRDARAWRLLHREAPGDLPPQALAQLRRLLPGLVHLLSD